MVTWSLNRSNGADSGYVYTTHLGTLWVTLITATGQADLSQEDLLAPWLGVLSLKVSAVISLGIS